MSISSIYKFVRKASPLGDYRNNSFVGHFISSQISPFFTYFFIKKSVIPNVITVFMILSGIIGAILFSVDNIYIKIVGVIFINLWFVFDCSDGEVARITKKFSSMGKEIDFAAHIINHPLFFISIILTVYQFYGYDELLIYPVIIIGILDVFYRGIASLDLIYNIKFKKEVVNKKDRIGFIRYVISNGTKTPNFVIFTPLLLIFDYATGFNLMLYYTFFTLFIMVLIIPRVIYYTVRKFVNC